MGPIALFDKSFLQSLSLDESLWFDHFFIANICPLFYVETLADLEKAVREGRSPEQEVGTISEKTPLLSGAPCVNHIDMCIAELLGRATIPLTGQIPLGRGRAVKSVGRTGVVFDEPPEAQAFTRWQEGKFLDVERNFARFWREALTSLDLKAIANGLRAAGVNGKSCRSLSHASAIARGLVTTRDKTFSAIALACVFFEASRGERDAILKRWRSVGCPPLSTYAPYAAHVLTVEIFFQVALAAHLISDQRASNRVDVAYLFYLPFCMVFVSWDGLHQRTAPLFLRAGQEFIWAPDLKAELHRIDQHFESLPELTKEKGIHSFARHPPGDDTSLVVRLWDRHLPRWRDTMREVGVTKGMTDLELIAEMDQMTNSRALAPNEIDFDPADADSLTIQRSVGRRRGKWWQLPKEGS